MEVLKQLQASLGRSIDQCFDNAHAALHREIAARDVETGELQIKASLAEEEQRKTLARLHDLQRENSILKEEVTDAAIDPKLAEIKARLNDYYAPEEVLKTSSDRDAHDLDSTLRERFKVLEERYRGIFSDMERLIFVCEKLHGKAKSNKEKLLLSLQWQAQRPSTHTEGSQPAIKDGKTHGASTESRRGSEVPGATGHLQEQLRTPEQDRAAKPNLKPTLEPNRSASQGMLRQNADHTKSDVAQSPPSDPSSTQPETPSTDSGSVIGNQSSDTALPSNSQLLKRKRSYGAAADASPSATSHEDARQHAIEVKSENTSSSPLRNISQYNALPPAGTQDLDDVGGPIETPTRHKPVTHELRNKHGSMLGYPSSNDQENRVHAMTGSTPPRSHTKHSAVLQPIDVNARNTRSPQAKLGKPLDSSSARILQITEDGDDSYNRSKKARTIMTPGAESGRMVSPATHGSASLRLDSLLDRPSPSKRLLNTPQIGMREINANTSQLHVSRRGNKSGTTVYRDSPLPRAAVLGTSASRGTAGHRTKEHEPHTGNDNPSSRLAAHRNPEQPRRTPYRALPINDLNLGHFKLNPEHNHGLDYAYHEVVRNKEARQHLAACTREDCCGKHFRAMLRVGGIPAGLSVEANADYSSTSARLRQLVGDNELPLDNLTEAERQDLLEDITAKTLAKQIGRHRHAHQRAASPPGFWRAEMPSTQELERDRKEARRVEREKIEERYREAMRPGGIWKFADE